MPKFCPNCGSKLVYERAKFCSECGFRLSPPEDKEELEDLVEDIEEEVKIRIEKPIYDLGKKLEEFVEKILNVQGFKTNCRVRLSGKSGAKHEIDILAEKKTPKRKLILAVECKNYSRPVPIKDIRDFVDKLRDLRIPTGIFATASYFSKDARQYAESHGIELWDAEKLKEKIFYLSVGRLETGKSFILEEATPLKVDYEKAISLSIKNPELVEEISSKLIWKPYYVISYSLRAYRRDPTKRIHEFKDSGDCIVEATEGKVIGFINTPKIELKSLAKSIGILEKTEDDILVKQLKIDTIKNLKVSYSKFYEIKKIPANISYSVAKKIAMRAIKERNIRTIQYEVKKRGRDEFDFDFFDREIREYKYVPKNKDIVIKSIRLVYVPKWEIQLGSGDHIYYREILASSGDIITDTIASCPDHVFKKWKRTIAVCSICGKALCEEHIFQCPVCGAWLCEEHGVRCKSCSRVYCNEHITKTCALCDSPVCDECAILCPICERVYCKEDVVKCDKCGEMVCKSCSVVIKKFFRTKYICKICAEKG